MGARAGSARFQPLAVAVLLLAGVLLRSEEAPCLQGLSIQRCAGCHPEDAPSRFERDRLQPCAPFCLACHAPKAMEKHHTIGTRLERPLRQDLHLDAEGRTTCATCHHLGRPRTDTVRWRSESLFDRAFRRQDRHKTYLLAFRNERGQLCKACH